MRTKTERAIRIKKLNAMSRQIKRWIDEDISNDSLDDLKSVRKLTKLRNSIQVEASHLMRRTELDA